MSGKYLSFCAQNKTEFINREVMPAPFTPLGDDLIADLYDRCVKLMVIEANGLKSPLYKHVRVGFPTYRQRIFLNLTEVRVFQLPSAVQIFRCSSKTG